MKRRLSTLFMSLLVITFLGLFGSSILTNIHSTYLRYLSQSSDVLIRNSAGAGATGFIVKGKSGKLYVMTNNHVCKLQENGYVFAIYRGDTYLLKVGPDYLWNDLCVIEAPSTATHPLRVAKHAIEGELAYVIGHPLLEPLSIALGELSGSVKISIVTGQNLPPEECFGPTYKTVDTSQTMYHFFGIDSVCVRTMDAEAANIVIQPGNSGSPVVDLYGGVIGVAFASNGSGRSYVVPLKDLIDFLSEL